MSTNRDIWNRLRRLPVDDLVILFADLQTALESRLEVFERKMARGD